MVVKLLAVSCCIVFVLCSCDQSYLLEWVVQHNCGWKGCVSRMSLITHSLSSHLRVTPHLTCHSACHIRVLLNRPITLMWKGTISCLQRGSLRNWSLNFQVPSTSQTHGGVCFYFRQEIRRFVSHPKKVFPTWLSNGDCCHYTIIQVRCMSEFSQFSK